MKNSLVFKKVLLVILLFVIAFTFSACSSVRSMTVENSNGTIDEIVSVTLDRNEILNKGYNSADIILMKKDITEKAEEKANQLILAFRYRIKALPFADVGLDVVKSKWENDTFVIGLRFDSLSIYQLYYGIEPNQPSDAIKTEKFLYTKHEYIRNTKFFAYRSLYNELKTYFSEQYPKCVNNDSNELLYTYISDTSRLKSDADYVTKENGKFYHTWVVDADNLDSTISMYYRIANRGNWLILCVITTLMFSCLLLLIALIVTLYKKNRRKKIIAQENNDKKMT